MITLNNTEKLLFLNNRFKCIKLYIDDYAHYCKINNKICDYEFCPILKSCFNIEEFIEIIEKKMKYKETKETKETLKINKGEYDERLTDLGRCT